MWQRNTNNCCQPQVSRKSAASNHPSATENRKVCGMVVENCFSDSFIFFMNTKNVLYKFLSTERWCSSAVFFIRIFLGIMMLIYGISNIVNYQMIYESFPDPFEFGHTTSLLIAIAIETICAVLLIIGFLVRPAAIVLGVFMIIILLFEIYGTSIQFGELPCVYLAICIMLAISGGMGYSLDRWFFKTKLRAEHHS